AGSKSKSRSAGSRSDAAVNSVRRHVRRLVVHPDPPPILARLPQVFGLIDQHIHALLRIARVLIENAPAIGEAHYPQARKQKQSPHDRPPAGSPLPVTRSPAAL